MHLVQVAEPVRPAALLADPLGAALHDLAVQLQAHCLVEASDGSVLAHALCDEEVPPPVVTAVLRRRSAALTGGLSGQRTTGVLPGGALLTARLPGWAGVLHSAPLMRGGQRLGWLWLLARTDLDVVAVAAAAAAVALPCPSATPDVRAEAVRAALDGRQPLPEDLVAGASVAWVMTVAGAAPGELRLALDSRPRPPRLQVVVEADRIRTVLLTGDDEAGARAQLRTVADELQATVGRRLRAGYSEPAQATAPLAAAAEQADAACGSSRVGECIGVRDARARIVLDVARAALRDLPDLGPDPVALLREHDLRRGTDLGRTVRCWLDEAGDAAAAAARLLVHPNTLRYRLKCAQTVTGTRFDDPAVRLELHLRLPP
jgi:hypothetical protein